MTRDEIVTKLEGLGLRAGDAAVDPHSTIRASRAGRGDGATHRSRELPTISIDLSEAPPPQSEAAARDLEVLGVLGEGGMGRVFVARQHSLDREVAIKSLHADADDRARLALLEEGAVTGHLEHPGIIPVHALGVDVASRPLLVMKRVEGVSWRELLRDPEHPSWKSRGGDPSRRLDDHLEILMQVCNAVHFAHSRGIVHRDIKPENVLIGKFADVYLADWGLAYRMRSGERPAFCGTPAYMAPEMVLGEAVDERTDVYLLGTTLHEILTGRVRHRGKDAHAVVAAAVLSEPCAYDASVPPALARIANKATAREPSDRYRDAFELKTAIAEYLRHQSSMALAASAVERLAKLRALLAQDADRANEDVQRQIDRLVTEARFGLSQAVEHWNDNPSAKEGLRDLDALLEARHARVAALERLAKDQDPHSEAIARNVAYVMLVVVGVGLSVSAFVQGMDYEPPVDDLVKQSFGPVGVVALFGFLLRKRLFRTAFNRRILLNIFTTVAAIAIGRLLGAKLGMRVPEMLVYDSLVAAACAVVSAASTFRAFVWCALGMLLTAIACAAWPARAFFAFSVGTAACLIGMLVFAAAKTKMPRR